MTTLTDSGSLVRIKGIDQSRLSATSTKVVAAADDIYQI